MSILDKYLMMSDNAALTASAISDVIDLWGDSTLTANIGGAEPAFWVVQTGTAFTDTGNDATLVAELVSDSTANLTTSPTVHASTGTIAFAGMTANRVLSVQALPYGAYERFLGTRYTVANGPFTAGTMRSFITRDPQYWVAFKSNNPAFR